MTGPIDWDTLVLQQTQRVFGEPVEWTSHTTGLSQTISGIFDEGFNRSETMDSSLGFAPVHVTTCRPILGCRTAEFPTPPQQEDRLLIREEHYIIQEVRSDSHGGLHLVLNETE